jgi:hypothetical protein
MLGRGKAIKAQTCAAIHLTVVAGLKKNQLATSAMNQLV